MTEQIGERIVEMLLGNDIQPRQPANPREDSNAPDKSRGLPGDLSGVWTGTVHTHRRDLPVTLWFKTSGDVHAQLDDQLKMLVNNARLETNTFVGRMRGDVGTPEANRRRYYLDWELTMRGDSLSGILYAKGEHPSRGIMVGHWVELQRKPKSGQ